MNTNWKISMLSNLTNQGDSKSIHYPHINCALSYLHKVKRMVKLKIEIFQTRLITLMTITLIVTAYMVYAQLTSTVTIQNTGQISTTTVWAKSGYWRDIQAAVDAVAAAGGGNVHIPEGTFNFVNVGESWRGERVVVPAGVSIFGAPTEKDDNGQVVEWKTVLVLPWDMPSNDAIGLCTWFIFGREGASVDKPTRFSDIKLVGYRYYNNSAENIYVGLRIQNILNFRVDHCCFQDLGDKGVHASGSSSPNKPMTHYYISGVIDHCIFRNTVGRVAPYQTRTVGYGAYVSRGGGYNYEDWETDIKNIMGHHLNYTVFIEDCYFEKWRHCVVCRQGAHVVLRYSTIQHSYGYGDVDIHGDYSGRAYEIYNVSFLDGVPDGAGTYGEAIWWRAGGGVVFNNTISGGVYRLFLGLSNENSDPDYQSFDIWIWNNTLNGVNYISSSGPVENQDYFRYAPSWYMPYPYPHPLTSK
ncbi:MAG: hypothetical protein ACPLIG_00805 [Candidatus Bathyarchaeales archaeon]